MANQTSSHVQDINIEGNGENYLTRDLHYPEGERLWMTSWNGGKQISTLSTIQYPSGNPLDTSWKPFYNGNILGNNWTVCEPDSFGLTGITSVSTNVEGTIDCDGAVLIGELKQGYATTAILKIPVNVTTPGTTEFTISGSGLTSNPDPYVIELTSSGDKDLYIPIDYDGTSLGSFTFSIDGMGTCNGNALGNTKKVLIPIIPTGPLCDPVTPATLSK